jgi:hypothetical protein
VEQRAVVRRRVNCWARMAECLSPQFHDVLGADIKS